MNFLSILSKIGSVSKIVVDVAASPAAMAVASVTPFGAEYMSAVKIILALEALLPVGNGAAKAAVAVPAIQALMPGATPESVATLNDDLVAVLKKFNAANTPAA